MGFFQEGMMYYVALRLVWWNSIRVCHVLWCCRSGCKYFTYGKKGVSGDKSKHCYWEYTSTAACSEGWTDDSYDFYQIIKTGLVQIGFSRPVLWPWHVHWFHKRICASDIYVFIVLTHWLTWRIRRIWQWRWKVHSTVTETHEGRLLFRIKSVFTQQRLWACFRWESSKRVGHERRRRRKLDHCQFGWYCEQVQLQAADITGRLEQRHPFGIFRWFQAKLPAEGDSRCADVYVVEGCDDDVCENCCGEHTW